MTDLISIDVRKQDGMFKVSKGNRRETALIRKGMDSKMDLYAEMDVASLAGLALVGNC